MAAYESPEFIRTSLGAAMALRLRGGRFYRDARPTCVNLLLSYEDGCSAGCRYCGLGSANGDAQDARDERSFIRVPWPVFGLEKVVGRLRKYAGGHQRVCISMVTHGRCFDDTLTVLKRVKDASERPISVLIAPTATPADGPARLREAGADMLGVGLDAASERIFRRRRPAHSWEHYWDAIRAAAAEFGPKKISVHLMAGLGETDEELLGTIARLVELGALAHLFSFFPEPGSPMQKRRPPPLRRYRRLQLARYLLQNRMIAPEAFGYDESGKLARIGASTDAFDAALGAPETFMTNGCPSADGDIACNRPFANERPSARLRNYPFPPTPADQKQILKQLRLEEMVASR